MAPKINRPDPPYLQIVDHIRQQIRSGALRAGDSVPSTRQITQDWGVAMATATKVITALRAEGLVTAVPGRGTVVRTSEVVHTPKDRTLAIRQSGRIYPPDEHAKITLAEIIEAPAQVADALGVTPGAPVIRRRRVTYRGDIPVSASTSWFDGVLAEQAPRLLQSERIVQGTPGYIEETTGRVMAAGRDQVAAAAASQEDADGLGIPVDAPVLRGRNWIYDGDGDVIEYGEYVSAAGRWKSYDYKITAE